MLFYFRKPLLTPQSHVGCCNDGWRTHFFGASTNPSNQFCSSGEKNEYTINFDFWVTYPLKLMREKETYLENKSQPTWI